MVKGDRYQKLASDEKGQNSGGAQPGNKQNGDHDVDDAECAASQGANDRPKPIGAGTISFSRDARTRSAMVRVPPT